MIKFNGYNAKVGDTLRLLQPGYGLSKKYLGTDLEILSISNVRDYSGGRSTVKVHVDGRELKSWTWSFDGEPVFFVVDTLNKDILKNLGHKGVRRYKINKRN